MTRPLPATVLDLAVDVAGAAGSAAGVRSRCVAEVVRASRGRPTKALDAWLALESPVQALAEWFGDAMPRSRRLLRLALDRDIAEIDALISAQVNAILHAPAFQRLEARWRALFHLVETADGNALAKIQVLTISWSEIVRDLERAGDFDRSQLYDKIYTQEFGTLGGEPFGLLVGDYEVQHRPSADHPTDDITALKSLAMIAAASFAPVVMGASPALFQLESFRELGRPFDLRSVFRQSEYERWQVMRKEDEMRFIGLAMPRVLMRLPYRPESMRRDGFRFEESVHAPGARDYLWGNAAFAFAAVTLRAFANFGWFADIRGAPDDEVRGGILPDLPMPYFSTDAPGVAEKLSTECALSHIQEKDLSELGFIGLRKVQYTTYSAFYANQSVQAPARYDSVGTNVNARLSSMLQYTLCISRFAHYIKILGRNRLGTLMTAEEFEEYVHAWLLGYCEGSDDASLETKARFPLREATVEIRETPGRPGAYSCKIFLRPHFQLDDVATGFRLVTQLAPAAAAP